MARKEKCTMPLGNSFNSSMRHAVFLPARDPMGETSPKLESDNELLFTPELRHWFPSYKYTVFQANLALRQPLVEVGIFRMGKKEQRENGCYECFAPVLPDSGYLFQWASLFIQFTILISYAIPIPAPAPMFSFPLPLPLLLPRA